MGILGDGEGRRPVAGLEHLPRADLFLHNAGGLVALGLAEIGPSPTRPPGPLVLPGHAGPPPQPDWGDSFQENITA